MSNIIRKAIVFNLDDPYQKELYDHVNKFKNFSYYGKSLVQKDYEENKKQVRKGGGMKIDLRENQQYYR